MAEQLINNFQTTLASAITDPVATSISLTSATGLPGSGNFRLLIGTEILLATAISGTTVTVTRGAESTTAATHSSGAAVTAIVTAASLAAWGLAQANNLSDLPTPATARTNLGLGTAALLTSSAVAQVANNLSDLSSAQTSLANLIGQPASPPTLAFYEPLFQSTGAFGSTSGATLTVAGGGGIVSGTNGTAAVGTIQLPKPIDNTKPWRVNVRIAYASDATNDVSVYFQNPNDTTYGGFALRVTGGGFYLSVAAGTGSTELNLNGGLVTSTTYDLFVASDGQNVNFGIIPVGRGGTNNQTGYNTGIATAENFNTVANTFGATGKVGAFVNVSQIKVSTSSSTNTIKGILVNQGSLGGGTDSRFQPPCWCPITITRPDGTVDNTGTLAIPESYTGASQFDLALVGHGNNSNEQQGFRTADPDTGTAFATLRANGVAMAYLRGDPSSFANNYASPWGAANGVNLWKQFYDTMLSLLPGPNGAPCVKNLHLIGQSMGGVSMLNFAMLYPSLPIRSFSGISAVVSQKDMYNGTNGCTNYSSTINGAFLTYYVSLSAGNTGNAVTNGTYWQQVTSPGGILAKLYAAYTNRGTYSGGTTYALNDVVSTVATSFGQVAYSDPNLRASALNYLPIVLWQGSADASVGPASVSNFVTTMTSEGNTPTENVISGGGHLNVSTLWSGSGLLANIQAGNALVSPVQVSAATSGTVTFAASRDQTIYLSSSSTIASITIALPTVTVIGQKCFLASKSIVTSLTLTGTVASGAALTALTAGGNAQYQAVDTAGTFVRIE